MWSVHVQCVVYIYNVQFTCIVYSIQMQWHVECTEPCVCGRPAAASPRPCGAQSNRGCGLKWDYLGCCTAPHSSSIDAVQYYVVQGSTCCSKMQYRLYMQYITMQYRRIIPARALAKEGLGKSSLCSNPFISSSRLVVWGGGWGRGGLYPIISGSQVMWGTCQADTVSGATGQPNCGVEYSAVKW